MWATLARWIAQFLLIPAITKAGAALYNYTIDMISRKKKDATAIKEGDAYAKAPVSSAQSDFDSTP